MQIPLTKKWFRETNNFPLGCVQTISEAHPVSCPGGNGVLSRGKARPVRDADYSPVSSAEANNM
jgi:hypothetical protein